MKRSIPDSRGILLDTSIWVRYLRPQGHEELKARVSEALVAERVFTCWVVKMELLIGAKGEEAFERLLSDLEALEEVDLTPELWRTAARLGFSLRKKGFTVPLPDLLVAQAAISSELELWHADAHFEQIREVSPLRTRPFL